MQRKRFLIMILLALMLWPVETSNAPIHEYQGLELSCAPTTAYELPTDSVEVESRDTVKYVANISWYTASADECGKTDGITASGHIAQAGVTIAADDLPLGTRVLINGHEYVVQDRFGAGHINRIDIYCESKEEALRNGRQFLEVEIL